MCVFTINPPATRTLCSKSAPRTPTFIRALPFKPIHFGDIHALAKHLQSLRGARGLQLTPAFASLAGSETFPIFNVYLTDDPDASEWVGAIAVQGRELSSMRMILAENEPAIPNAKAA